MPVKKGPDGRKFHTSNTGVDIVADSSESEEEVPPSRPATSGSAYFSNVINEAKTGKQDTQSIAKAKAGTKDTQSTAKAKAGTKDTQSIAKAKAGTRDIRPIAEARPQNTPASRSHVRPGLAAQVAVHNWVPESHPADGTEAHATLEKKIRKNRDGLLCAAVKVCKTGHVVLVMHWSPSDPLNRRGTWSLEVFDCRVELWGEFGVEAHEQCRGLSTADDIVRALAKAMIEKWEPVLPNLPTNKERSDPDCDKRELLNAKFNIRSLPSLRELERELRPLAVYAVGQLPRGQGGKRDDQNDKDENDKKNNGDQKATKDDLQAQRKAAQERARLAHLRKIIDDQKGRQYLDRDHLGKLDAIAREAQRRANGTGGVWNSDSRSFIPRSSFQCASLTDEVEHIPTTPSRTKTDGQNNKPAPKKAAKTEEEDADLKRIRVAARKDREREEQEERAEEEWQRELAAQKEEAELRERATLEDTDSNDEDINAAVVEALENGSFDPEGSEEEPAKTNQEDIDSSESTKSSSVDEPGPKNRKQRQEPRGSVTPITPDSPDTDSVKPPQPSTPVKTKPNPKSKAKPANPTATNETKKVKIAGESKVEKTKSLETKDPNASNSKEKKHKSGEFISNNDLEDEETTAAKLSSDKLQTENLSVETTQTTSTTVQSTHGTNIVQETTETTTLAVSLQHPDNSAQRTEITATTTATTTSSSTTETAISYTTHTDTPPVTHLPIPHPPLPHNTPPPSPARSPKDGYNTPTNTLGIEVHIAASPGKRKDPPEQGNRSPPVKKHTDSASPSSAEGATANGAGHAMLSPAGSCGSSTSSSGKKRKRTWVEEDRDVGNRTGSKRVKGVESSGGEGDKGTVHAGLSVGLDDVEKVEMGDDDDDDDGGSWDSLFDE